MANNKLVRTQFGGVDYYFGEKTTDLGGKQWLGKIDAIGDIVIKTGKYQTFEASTLQIRFNNNDGYFNPFMTNSATKYVYGNDTEVYEGSTSLKKYRTLNAYFEGTDFIMNFTDQFGSLLDTPVWDKVIDQNTYPNANPLAYNKVINRIFGEIPKPANSADFGKYMLRCESVKKSATERYLIGKHDKPLLSLQYVLDPNGTDITGSSSLVFGSDGYWYVNYATDVDYILVNFTATYETSTQMLGHILDEFNFEYNLSYLIISYFSNFTNNYEDIFGVPRWNYIINDIISGKQILQDLCYSLNIDYFVDFNNKITMLPFDAYYFFEGAGGIPAYTYQEGEIISFKVIKPDEREVKNQIQYSDSYDIAEDTYRRTRLLKNYDSINNYNDVIHNLAQSYKTMTEKSASAPFTTAKNSLIVKLEPEQMIEIKIDKITYNLKPADLTNKRYIRFAYPEAITKTERGYFVKEIINETDQDGKIKLKLLDVEHYTKLDKYQMFKINANDVQNSQIINDISVRGHFEINNFGVYHDTTIKRYGTSSLKFDGSSYFECATAGTPFSKQINFHFMNQDNFNVWGDVRFNVSGNSEIIYCQYVDANNHIFIGKHTTDQLRFFVRIGGVLVVALTSTTALSINTWYEFMVARTSGGHIGLYIDGNIEAYTNYATKHYFYVPASFGRFNPTTPFYFNGYSDRFQINYANQFELTPDAGLTDYYMPYTKQQNFYKLEKNIEVTNPVDNDFWTIGNNYNIEWDAEILSNAIEISLYQGNTFIDMINSSIDPRTSPYVWTAGDIEGGGTFPAGTYIMKIKEVGGTVEAFSKSFTLV